MAEANQGKLAMDDLAGVAGLAKGLYDELLGAADGNTGKLDEILAKLANSDAKDKHEILIDRARAEIISYRLKVWLDPKQPSSLLRQTASVHLTTPVLWLHLERHDSNMELDSRGDARLSQSRFRAAPDKFLEAQQAAI